MNWTSHGTRVRPCANSSVQKILERGFSGVWVRGRGAAAELGTRPFPSDWTMSGRLLGKGHGARPSPSDWTMSGRLLGKGHGARPPHPTGPCPGGSSGRAAGTGFAYTRMKSQSAAVALPGCPNRREIPMKISDRQSGECPNLPMPKWAWGIFV
jgi:hypothetical protein